MAGKTHGTSQSRAPVSRALTVGVVGLGRSWGGPYGAALDARPDLFRVRAVADAVPDRAEQEARKRGCAAAAGLTELVHAPGVEAVLVLGGAWYGLWPVEAAGGVGKPVFCVPTLELLEDRVGVSLARLAAARTPVVFAPRVPRGSTAELVREVLQERLGRVRSVVVRWDHAGGVRSGVSDVTSAGSAELLAWCAEIFGADPVRFLVAGTTGIAGVFVDFGKGRGAQIVHRFRSPGHGRVRIDIAAERGSAIVAPPVALSWRDRTGWHRHRVPGTPSPARTQLEQFHATVTRGGSCPNALPDLLRALPWLRAVARSRAEGGWAVSQGVGQDRSVQLR
jgi:predicted dehydrogenase